MIRIAGVLVQALLFLFDGGDSPWQSRSGLADILGAAYWCRVATAISTGQSVPMTAARMLNLGTGCI